MNKIFSNLSICCGGYGEATAQCNPYTCLPGQLSPLPVSAPMDCRHFVNLPHPQEAIAAKRAQAASVRSFPEIDVWATSSSMNASIVFIF